ncbi:hypothetical protein [Christiangramia sp. ASW11-125]|uniref:hypothetical protein n=1 Tax=Christiangramia sp. ASW11-125 TaxID=3400701 RepID=UPI003AAC9072
MHFVEMKNLIFTIILIGFTTILSAQENIDKEEMVGFACYYEGSASKTVKKVTRKLKNRNYSSISKLLNSENNAEKYMAAITLEELAKRNKYKLDPKEKLLIEKIKNSDELVSVCSGCLFFQKMKLKDMFVPEFEDFALNWKNQFFKTKFF